MMLPVNTKHSFSLFLSILLFVSGSASIKAQSIEKQAALAVLTFNVASFTRWPNQSLKRKETSINLCVYGSNIVQQSFESMNNRKVHGKIIHTITLTRLRNLEQCQLLYISELKPKRLAPLLTEIQGQAILTLGDTTEFIESGGMVGLENNNGKMQITVNLPMVKKSGLVISSRLLKLAKIVDYPIQK